MRLIKTIVTLVVIASFAGLVFWVVMQLTSTPDLPEHVAAPSGAQTTSQVTATGALPSVPRVVSSSEPSPLAVAQSAPVELRVPSLDMRLSVYELPVAARNPIDPPSFGDAWWDPAPVTTSHPATSYGLGTDAPDLAVIAAHTSAKTPDAAFNPFYDWKKGRFRVKSGAEIWVKTQASGNAWLVYRLVKTHTPQKGDGPNSLMHSEEIWGTDAQPRPNHLLLIGCKQIGPGQPSQENIVLDTVFSHVVR